MDYSSVTEPAAASEPGTAVTQPIPAVAECCSQCLAPLAADQRYCLECGTPRAHVRGPIGGGGVSGQPRPPSPSPSPSPKTPPPGIPGGPPPSPPGGAFGQAGGSNRNNTLALLAGVGVLLLAMGIGVLIGRAGAGSSKAAPPQVISVGGSSGGTSTTPTTTTPSTGAPATGSKTKTPAKAKGSSGAGSSLTKPAPPSAVQNLRSGGSGESFEQKSKNLPNNVET